MVLYKRKPVQPLPRPTIEDDNVDVWVVGQTGEIFTDYEHYLKRMDFYKQRKFICEITGHSGLSYFDALKSEMDGSRDVERSFPEALRDPVLRKVQFSTISRIDNLVDFIFDEFKHDFYPGEQVTVSIDDGQRLTGVVREKAKFPELRRADGSVERRAFARYFVPLINEPSAEALVDDMHIMRDRKSFTKQILRSFIKNSVSRESWTGAPWLVKESIANDLKIDTEVPLHLRHNNKVAEKKAQLAQKKSGHDGNIMDFFAAQPRLPELKPATKSHKSKQFQQQIARNKQQQWLEYQQALAQSENGGPPPAFPISKAKDHGKSARESISQLAQLAAKVAPKVPPPPPPIKYPIEDLDIAPSRDGTHRPRLRYLGRAPSGAEADDGSNDHIAMENIGSLLETWETLNVYCEIFQLDSFTFDDFVEALEFSSEDVECELLVEIHCAVLKILVDANGKLLVALPDMPEEEDESDEEDEEQETSVDEPSAIPTPTPEPEVKSTRRSTRSSLGRSSLNVEQKQESEEPREATPDDRVHSAIEMLAEYGWVERLQKRDFRYGGWETIIVGLLYQLSLNEKFEARCEEILKELAPVDEEPTQETARQRYASLDVNLRIKTLQILCMLTVETKAVRAYMEECSEQMTGFRKEKLEWQRNRKALLEELRVLNEERKTLLPEESIPSPAPEADVSADTKMTGTEEDEEVEEEDPAEEDEVDDSEEEIHTGRSLRRGNDRAADRKRKREEEKEKKEKAEAAAKVPKMSNQLKKVLKEMDKKKEALQECEDEINTLDNDLREADCPRARCLGKDRFWNRYWWFEKNGMPYAGLPTSSTAEAGYANGRLWVQGPDAMERQGFIDLQGDEAAEYQKKHKMSMGERKKLEEGRTQIYDARQWAYYDDSDSLEMLIGWLDSRGNRELKLRKELQIQREKIALHMKKRQDYLDGVDDKAADEPAVRVSTRKRTYVDPGMHRCLNWKNTMALEELGHLHSEQPKPRKAAKKSAGAVDRSSRSGGASNSKGRSIGRQGSRYHF